MKRVAVLGKGRLAIETCELISAQPGWRLAAVVPTEVEPDWDLALSEHVARTCPGVPIIRSGDWRELDGTRLDLACSILYDKIIGASLLSSGCRIVNFHPGRLPEYRGVRPVNWALRDGECVHGVTLHQVDAGVDTGPVLAQVLFPIWPETDEVRDVWARCMRYGRLLLADTLPRIDGIAGIPQDESRARTHHSRDNAALGERLSWTRAESLGRDEEGRADRDPANV